MDDVGIALLCISWQLRFCRHLALKGDAQTRSTLDALLALNTIRTNRTLDTSSTFWSLDALGASSASKAIKTGLHRRLKSKFFLVNSFKVRLVFWPHFDD